MITIISSFVIAISLIALYQVYRFLIKPKVELDYYKNQGLPVNFVPFYGYRKQALYDLHHNKDLLYSWKQLNNMNPRPRAFASNLGQHPVVALKDTELIKQLYVNQEKYYNKAPVAVGLPKLILNNATVVAEGEQWKRHRKLSGVLYNYDKVRELIPDMVNIINEELDKLKEKKLDNINFLIEVQHIMTELTGKLFLGLELSKLQFKGQTVSSFVAEIIDRAGLESFETITLIMSPDLAKKGLHPRHKALVQDIQDLRTFLFGAAKAKLEEILASKDTPSTNQPLLLQVIYEQMLKMNDSELTAVDLVDEFANFAMGLMDTTSHALLFSSYFILQNKDAHKKVLEEVRTSFKNLNQINVDALNQMEYTTAVIKETLRLAAPLPNLLPRIALQDHNLGDLKIKEGTIVVIAAVTNSFDPEYHDEPDKFVPERWTDENSRTRKAISKNAYVYIPFSSGARVCSGQQLAMNVMKIFLGLFVEKFDYELSDKKYEMIFSSKFFSEPHNPLVYNLKVQN